MHLASNVLLRQTWMAFYGLIR